MTTFLYHSIANPPQPGTWRIRREEHDVWIDMWCPNGHKMKLEARRDFGLVPVVPMNIAYRCVGCGFADMVWLTSSKDPYGTEIQEVPAQQTENTDYAVFTGFSELDFGNDKKRPSFVEFFTKNNFANSIPKLSAIQKSFFRRFASAFGIDTKWFEE